MSTKIANASAIVRVVSLAAGLVAETQITAGRTHAGDEARPTAVSIQTISDAWRKQQAVLRTVQVIWSNRQVTVGVKESLSLEARHSARGAAVLKASMVALESKSAMCLEDDKLSYTCDTPAAGGLDSPESRIRVPSHLKLVLMKTQCRKYTDRRVDPLVPDAATAVLSVKPPEECDEVRLPDVRPLLLALRPLTQRLSSINLSRYRISAVRGAIGERSCVILEPIPDPVADNQGRLKHSFWLDPSRDYVVVRAWVKGKGQRVIKTDIDYAQDPVLGWMPTVWSTVTLDASGHLQDAFHSKIDRIVANRPIASADFQNERPPGASAAGPLIRGAEHTEALQPTSGRTQAARPGDAKPHALTRLQFVVVVNLFVLVAVGGFLAARRRTSHLVSSSVGFPSSVSEGGKTL